MITSNYSLEGKKMLTLLFTILMIMAFGKLIIWAIKATWGITKVLVTIVFFPIILIGLACAGAIYLALILLIIGGGVAFIRSAVA